MGTSILPQFETECLKELKELKQWVCWKLQQTKDRSAKLPWTPYGSRASVRDETQWSSYEACFTETVQLKYQGAHRGLNGIGFVFSEDDPYVGIDLDKCRDYETGEIEDWALKVIKQMDTYTEISPSGTGLHMICRGHRMEKGRNQQGKNPEMYSWGRFFTFSGLHLDGTPETIEDRHVEVRDLEKEFFGDNIKSTVGDESITDAEFNIRRDAMWETDRIEAWCKNSALFQETWNHKRKEFDNDMSKYDAALAVQAVQIGCGPEEVAALIASHRRTTYNGKGLGFEKAFRIDYIRRTYFYALQCVRSRTTDEDAEIREIINTGGEEAVAELSSKLGISITKIIKRASAPSIYYIVWHDQEICLGTSRDLLIQDTVRAAVGDATRVVINFKTRKDWLNMYRLILSCAVFEELHGAGSNDELYELILEYMRTRPAREDQWQDAASAGSPYIKDGEIHINRELFRAFLVYGADYRLKPRELSFRLKQAGFTQIRIQCKDSHGNQVNKRYWKIKEEKLES